MAILNDFKWTELFLRTSGLGKSSLTVSLLLKARKNRNAVADYVGSRKLVTMCSSIWHSAGCRDKERLVNEFTASACC